MTKKNSRKQSSRMQKSTLDTMALSPPRGGRTVPPGFLPNDGTKEEEIEALKIVFRIDGSNPYKDDPYNIYKRFMPMTRYEEPDYHVYLTTLHDEDMDVDNKYVAIQNLIKQLFSTQHAWVPPTWTSGSRYQYNKPLHTILHQPEPPYERRRKELCTYSIESPPKIHQKMR